ncbi:MAG: hypothetical protein ACRDQD_13775 [Nocardioidaceae bacterium]
MREVDVALLHAALDAHRVSRGLSWRDVAAETGLSASTFSRMGGGHVPNLNGFVVMCRWLGAAMETFTGLRRRAPAGASVEAELVALTDRHRLTPPEQEFLLAAVKALTAWRQAHPS